MASILQYVASMNIYVIFRVIERRENSSSQCNNSYVQKIEKINHGETDEF